MVHRFRLVTGVLVLALAAAGCSRDENTAAKKAAIKWAEQVSEEVTNRGKLTYTAPSELPKEALLEVKGNLEWKSDLTLKLIPGYVQVSFAGEDACVTLAGGLHTKSPVSPGACPVAPSNAPRIQASEDEGVAISALQLWVSAASDDPAWRRLKTVEDVQAYIADHLDTPVRGVTLNQPTPNRVRAVFRDGSWCATFWMLTTGLATKLESCSVIVPIPRTNP